MEDFNNRESDKYFYAESIKEIPEWFLELSNLYYDTLHDIDYDFSGDSSLGE